VPCRLACGFSAHKKNCEAHEPPLVNRIGTDQSINQSKYFIVILNVDQKAGLHSLQHLGITETEKIGLKHKTDQQLSPVNSLEP